MQRGSFGGITTSVTSPQATSPASPLLSAAPSSPPFAGDCRRCPRLLQARRSWETTAAVRGSPRPADCGRSTPSSAAHPGPPIGGDRSRRPWLTQACRSREISAAVRGSHKSRRWQARLECMWQARLECIWQARRPAADSSPGPVDLVHTSRPGVPCLCLVVPSGTVLIITSCVVHGDSLGAGGSSGCGHGGHSQPPASPVVEVEAVAEGPCEGP